MDHAPRWLDTWVRQKLLVDTYLKLHPEHEPQRPTLEGLAPLTAAKLVSRALWRAAVGNDDDLPAEPKGPSHGPTKRTPRR